jgi:hypothetical protein
MTRRASSSVGILVSFLSQTGSLTDSFTGEIEHI